jgi:hypothetical protein
MIVEMREDKHLTIHFNPGKGDARQVIIDEDARDIRICDGKHVVKVRFSMAPSGLGYLSQAIRHKNELQDILVDDVFVTFIDKASLKKLAEGQRT